MSREYITKLDLPIAELNVFYAHCESLYPFLCSENQNHNLTRILSEEDYWIKHVADSLLLLKYLPKLTDQKVSIADLGCGAGFPALVLALALPDSQVTAIDSIGKKTEFVRKAGEFLGLKNLQVVNGRGRELAAKAEWFERFDLITARAVSESKKIFREVRRMLNPDGEIVLYKTPEAAEEEVGGVRKVALGWQWQISDIYELPEAKGSRCFLEGKRLA